MFLFSVVKAITSVVLNTEPNVFVSCVALLIVPPLTAAAICPPDNILADLTVATSVAYLLCATLPEATFKEK